MTMRIVNINLGDWDTGTAGMSAELEGFYWRIVRYMYAHGGSCVNDDVRMACALRFEIRVYRRLKCELIADGKITVFEGMIRNARVSAEVAAYEARSSELSKAGSKGAAARKKSAKMVAKTPPAAREVNGRSAQLAADLQPTSVELSPNLAPTSAELSAEVRVNFQENPKISTSPQWPSYQNQNQNQNHTTEERHADAPAAGSPAIERDVLQAKLIAAANGSLANFANAPGLLNLSTPHWWIEQGCDLDRDVLPAIAEVGRRKHGQNISSWDYFTKPVTAAKARRAKGLPDVGVSNAPAATLFRSVDDDWRLRMKHYVDAKFWSEKVPGTEPGTANCRVPPAILREFGFEPVGRSA